MCQIPYFYIFCYLKKGGKLDVYFQSASEKDRSSHQSQYDIEKTNIGFEGLSSAFTNSDSSFISISDPGHYIPDLCSSFYIGTKDINFVEIITKIIEKIAILADIELESTFLFGSSAGSMSALMSSTYFSKKVNVMAVNSQITVQNNKKLINNLFKLNVKEVMTNFPNRVSCLHRFRQKTFKDCIPNIYIMANINDNLYRINYVFYQLYQRRFTRQGIDNQSFFDSYFGVEGHARPHKAALKVKIELARKILTIKSNKMLDKKK
jgi:hypothetical protein